MNMNEVVRNIDELGRVVLPLEIRKILNINPRDKVSLTLWGKAILLKKLEEGCVLCSGTKDVVEFGDKEVCVDCIRKLQKLID